MPQEDTASVGYTVFLPNKCKLTLIQQTQTEKPMKQLTQSRQNYQCYENKDWMRECFQLMKTERDVKTKYKMWPWVDIRKKIKDCGKGHQLEKLNIYNVF